MVIKVKGICLLPNQKFKMTFHVSMLLWKIEIEKYCKYELMFTYCLDWFGHNFLISKLQKKKRATFSRWFSDQPGKCWRIFEENTVLTTEHRKKNRLTCCVIHFILLQCNNFRQQHVLITLSNTCDSSNA